MAEDRLKKDYDVVENLGDLIKAREERTSAFADDIDAMDDIDLDHLPFDAADELKQPHSHGPSEEEQMAIDVELMGAPKEKEVEFDWQDSAEEMLPTDPESSEGMGDDEAVEQLARVDPADLAGPVPSVEIGSETATAATKAEKEEYEMNGGEEAPPLIAPVQMESAMDTDSDEEDFRIIDRFEGEVDRETALVEFEEMREVIEEESER